VGVLALLLIALGAWKYYKHVKKTEPIIVMVGKAPELEKWDSENLDEEKYQSDFTGSVDGFITPDFQKQTYRGLMRRSHDEGISNLEASRVLLELMKLSVNIWLTERRQYANAAKQPSYNGWLGRLSQLQEDHTRYWNAFERNNFVAPRDQVHILLSLERCVSIINDARREGRPEATAHLWRIAKMAWEMTLTLPRRRLISSPSQFPTLNTFSVPDGVDLSSKSTWEKFDLVYPGVWEWRDGKEVVVQPGFLIPREADTDSPRETDGKSPLLKGSKSRTRINESEDI